MAILKILKYGDPRLQQPAEPVTEVTEEIQRLVQDMLETMYYANGIGLAANQVGVLKRVFVIDLHHGRRPDEVLVVLNPTIVEVEGEVREEEGCLSFPGLYAPVYRPRRVRLRGQTLTGEWREWEGEGLLARAFSHETDHLDGRLIIDRMSPLTRASFLRRVAKRQRHGEWAGDE
jgi:peptide deformylase